MDSEGLSMELLREIREATKHNTRLIEANGRRIAENGRRIEANGRRLEDNARRLEANARKLEENGRRIDANTARLDGNGAKLGRLERQVVQTEVRTETALNGVQTTLEQIRDLFRDQGHAPAP